MNSKEIIHLYDSPTRLINNKEPTNYIQKTLRDNLSNIYELDYNIENNLTEYADANTSSNKISSIYQKEYIININQFRTLVNPANEIFYNQNTFYNKMLKPNIYENSVRRSRWGLKF